MYARRVLSAHSIGLGLRLQMAALGGIILAAAFAAYLALHAMSVAVAHMDDRLIVLEAMNDKLSRTNRYLVATNDYLARTNRYLLVANQYLTETNGKISLTNGQLRTTNHRLADMQHILERMGAHISVMSRKITHAKLLF